MNEKHVENAYWHLLSTRGTVVMSVTTWKPKTQICWRTLEAISVTTSYVKKIVYEGDDVAHTAAESAFIITMKQALLFRINGCLPELI